MDAGFLDHYEKELTYLRKLGGEFASQYPKIAGRLGVSEFDCGDPFVERLLEGFAFMAARVQRRIDSEFPVLTQGLLDTVFPDFSRPIPSAAVFQINPDFQSSSLNAGFELPRGTTLVSKIASGHQTPCRFDTTADLCLWPLRISEVSYFSRESAVGLPMPRGFHQRGMRSGLSFVIESVGGKPLSQVPVEAIKLYLRGGAVAQDLYEQLVAHSGLFAGKAVSPRSEWQCLDQPKITPLGFSAEEALTPSDARSFTGYRLLQEYFTLPEKFLFVELGGLQSLLRTADCKQMKVVIGFDSLGDHLVSRVQDENIALNCVPAINLFERRADRLHVDHTQSEHQLIVDRSRPLDYEIWSISELAGHRVNSNSATPILPIYAPPPANSERLRHAMYYAQDRRPRLVSHSRREAEQRAAYPGSELFLSITDSHQQPFRHQFHQLSSKVFVTNRDLPLFPPEGGWLNAFGVLEGGPISSVKCIREPTRPRTAMMGEGGDKAWRLISHLTPNYLSLSEPGGAAMLREMLLLYCDRNEPSSQRQIDGLAGVKVCPVTSRLPLRGPLTFGRGSEIELFCEEDAFEGGGVFLLASILQRFFARYASLNSFTQTVLRTSRRGQVYRWPVQLGERPAI